MLAGLKGLRGMPLDKAVLVTSVATRAKAKAIAGDYGVEAEAIVAQKVYPALDRQIALVAGRCSQARRRTTLASGASRTARLITPISLIAWTTIHDAARRDPPDSASTS